MTKNIIISVIILSLGFWLACDREIPSDFDLGEFPDAPPAPSNLRIQVGDNILNLSWDMENPASISKYFIYRSSNVQDTVHLYDSSTTTGYVDDGVQNGNRYIYQVSALSTQNIEGSSTAPVSAIAGVFSIAIDNDAEFTSSRDVFINPTAPERTAHIMLSNSEDFAGAKWLNYSNSVSWQLTDGDGEKTVYARFKDSDGNQTAESFSDNITLDTRAEIDTFYISGPASSFEPGDLIHFVLDSGEPGGSARVEISDLGRLDLFDNGSNGDAVAGNGIYKFDYVIPPNTEVAGSSVTGMFTDRAGNEAPDFYLPYLIDITSDIAPDPVALAIQVVDSVTFRLTWTQNENSDFESYRIYRSTSSGVTNIPENLIIIENRQNTTMFTDEGVIFGNTYYYKVYVYDRFGASAGSNEVFAPK
ncbi:MAG TPA: hypothetical protein ENO22_10470 [candidate division Zixibacteria bacterium]|nr:hypothetical protein [candidate division Zixibacteria bacterium]HEQ99751.1 hypothetical protein [candidate division Zixibacteria bacterium]